MAYAVTPAIDLGEQEALPPCSLHTAVQEQQCAYDWGSLPPDLLFRVAGWLHYRRDLPAVSQTCVAWHRALKSQTTYLRPHCLGDPALGSTFPHVRALSAPLLRHYGPPGASAPYLAPLRRPELLPRLFPHLTSLDISGQDLGPSRLRLLLPLAPRLQHLDASACRLCPRDAAALGCLTALQSLAFNHVVPVPDQPGAGGRAAADDWSSSAPAGWDTQHGDEAGGGDAADPDGDGGDWTVGSDDDGSGAAAALAEALAGALPRLQRLRRLELDADDPASPPAPPPAAGFLHLAINPAAAAEAAAAAAAAAAAPNPFNAAVPLEDLDELDVDGDPDLAAAALFGHAPPPPPPSPRGIPLLHHAACLAALPSLRCLRLRGNALSAADLAHVASCTALTELALLWNPRRQGLQLSVSCWAALLAALPRLEVLDVDFAGWDVRERMSLVPLRAQQGGTQPPGGAAAADGGTAGAAGAHAGAGLANRQQQQQQQQIQAARAGAGRTAQRGGGTGASGAGGRGEAVAAGGGGRAGGSGPLGCLRSLSLRQCNSPDLVLSVMACGGALTRLELPAAGEHVTPYLVAQVCSRLPALQVLDVSSSFRSRARFQLGGDLLVRDLAVLRPGLAALGLGGVPMHGSGMPDGRDLMYLPFVEVDVSAATGAGAGVGAEGGSASNGGSSTGGAGAAEDLVDWDAQAPGSGSRYGAAGCSGGSNSSSVAARLRSAGWEREREREEGAGSGEGRQGGAGGRAGMRGRGAVPEAEPVQLPFPLLSQLEVHGAVWMKSRFRALANLRGLQELRVSAMSPHDFLATCKMGCYDALSGLAALTALHVTGAAAAAPGTQGAAGGPAAAAAAAGAGAEDAAGAGLGAGPGAGGFAGALGMAGGPGAGPSGSMRREPHLNFIQNLESLQVLALETLTTCGLCFRYMGLLRRLRVLSLGGCIAFSADGFACFRAARMTQLQSLKLLGCQWEVLEPGHLLAALPATCPSLEHLELGDCPGLTATQLAELLLVAPAAGPGPGAGARQPPFSHPGVGVGAAAPGSASLPLLRYLMLHGAPQLTEGELREAPLAVGSLRFLAASGCGGGGGVVALARYGSAMQPVALTAAQLAAEAAKAAARSGWGGPGDRGGGGTAVGGAGGRGIGGVVGAALAARVGAHGVPLPG